MGTKKNKYRVSLEVEVETVQGGQVYAHQAFFVVKQAMESARVRGYETAEGVVGFDYRVSQFVVPLTENNIDPKE